MGGGFGNVGTGIWTGIAGTGGGGPRGNLDSIKEGSSVDLMVFGFDYDWIEWC